MTLLFDVTLLSSVGMCIGYSYIDVYGAQLRQAVQGRS